MNPFRHGQVVSGEDFCPRPELMENLTGFMKSGQNVVLLGERRTGKTSLACEAVRANGKRRLLYTDLLEIKSVDDLCKRLIKALVTLERESGFVEKILRSLSQLKPTLGLDPLTGQPSISLDATVRLKPDSMDGLLDMIEAVHRRKRVIVVLDEFQDILNLKDCKVALANLRSKVQFHAKIPYVFVGSIRNKMGEIFTHPESPFFKSAVSLDVGPLDEEQFLSFLTKKFARGKRRIDPPALQCLFALADAVPGDVQQLCGALWEITSYKDRITEKNIPAALKLIHARELKGYEAMLVLLTDQQLRCLAGLARMGGKAPMSSAFVKGVGIMLPASIKKALNRLMKLKIIYHHEGEYKFVNPFFKSWLIYKDY